MSCDCLRLRTEVRPIGKRLQREQSNPFLRQTFSTCKREYNMLKKKLKSNFFKSFMNKINDLDQKDSKSFWKSINSLRHSKNKSVNPISATKWVEHYKFLLTDPSSFNFSLFSDVEETKDDLCSLDYTFNLQGGQERYK
jgi:hypothetical protein